MASISLRKSALAGAASAVFVFGLGACNRAQVVQGECRPLHGSDVCVWSESSGNTLVAFGATVPIGMVENAPADAPMVWPPVAGAAIPLPEVVKSATGFNVLTVYSEPHGHPPGPYLVPHFDFHFYTLEPAGADAIDCADVTKPGRLPVGYVLPDVTGTPMGDLIGLCVPKMGVHALPEAEMKATTTFKSTMVVGYYRTRPIFIEPMITKAVLLERKSFTIAVPEVPDQPANVRYPTTFRADYDATAKTYRFTFSGLPAAGGQ